MDKTFWNRTWESIEADRVSSYVTGFNTSEDNVIAFLRKKKAKYVCDAGCGCGAYSLKLARFGFEISGFDIAEEAIVLTKKLLSVNGYPTKDFKQANILSTGYKSESFDAVVAKDVIDHMPIKQGAETVKELLRIVKPGGCVLLTLDETDCEYESSPHETNKDGDFLFISGKWDGMVFHPYSESEIKKLTSGIKYKIPPSNEPGFTVVLEAGE